MTLLLLLGCSPGRLDHLPTGTLSIGGGALELEVWIAEEPQDRATGLMGVEELDPGRGMVFLHPAPTTSTFTMRGTLIPLTLAVWGPDGRIAATLDMTPCRTEPCPSYDPGVEWIGAVEAAAGALDGVGLGDRVALER